MSNLLIAVRAVHFTATIMLAGGLAFTELVAEPVLAQLGAAPSHLSQLRQRIARILWTCLALAVVSGAGWLVLLTSQITGWPVSQVFSADGLWSVLTDTQFGHDLQVRGVLLLLLALALFPFDPQHGTVARWQSRIALILAGSMLAALAWAGHAGATESFSGYVHLAADALHLVAAGAWLGALVPLALFLRMAHRAAEREWTRIARDVTVRFSTLGIISVATLLVTGIINTWFLAGTLPALVGTDYGRLLLLKVALFLAMVFIASINRFRLTPKLSLAPSQTQKQAVGELARNSLAETGLGVFIVCIVGALGTLPPAAHVQPRWPFSVRVSDDVFAVPELGIYAIVCIAATICGTLLLLSGIFLRRWRWPGIIIGFVVIVFFARGLVLLTVPAYPTSFYTSPTRYSAQSIARGKVLFQERCSGCHGTEGRGDGPLAGRRSTKGSDLTADHIYDHSDGDLFWWITTGLADRMPGFGSVLDEDARWALIDFIHANADAIRLQRAGAKIAPGFPAPDFSAECPDGSMITLEQLRGRIVHIMFVGRDSAERVNQLKALNTGAGVGTIVVSADASSRQPTGLCLVDDPDVVTAYALYRGAGVSDFSGTEFLIDPAGALRSMSYPGLPSDWRNPETLMRQIAQILRTPSPASKRLRRSAHH